ncbi:MAG: shikimate dehydrogenase [Fimbriimonadales bacterium]
MNWRDVEPWQPFSLVDMPTIGAPGYTHGLPQYSEGRPFRLGIIGDPVEHSLSPKMQVAALTESGFDGEYIAIQVPNGELPDAIEHLRDLGFVGLNVTLPHKQHALLIEQGDATVRAVGAANSIKIEKGDVFATNTDAIGFFRPIQDLLPGKALVLGAGGAAAAVVYALSENDWDVQIWNRTAEKAEELARRVAGTVYPEPDPTGCTLVVNATSLGLHEGDRPQLIWENLEENATVYDLAYRQGTTDFLQIAAQRGNQTIDGKEMLVAQGAASFHWWTGRKPSIEVMREAIGL